jgi:hypothetical protein
MYILTICESEVNLSIQLFWQIIGTKSPYFVPITRESHIPRGGIKKINRFMAKTLVDFPE